MGKWGKPADQAVACEVVGPQCVRLNKTTRVASTFDYKALKF